MADEVAGEDWVEMSHPDVEQTARVTREAFNTVWSGKGWTLVSAPSPAAPSPPTPLAPPVPPQEGH